MCNCYVKFNILYYVMEIFNISDRRVAAPDNITIYLFFRWSKIKTDMAVDILDISDRTRNSLYKNWIFHIWNLLKKSKLLQKIAQWKTLLEKSDIIDLFNKKWLGTKWIKEIYYNLVWVKFEVDWDSLTEFLKKEEENNNDRQIFNKVDCFIIKNGIRIDTDQPVEVLNLSERAKNGLLKGWLFSIKNLLKNEDLIKRAETWETIIEDWDIVNLYGLQWMWTTCVTEICNSLVWTKFITCLKEFSNDDLRGYNEINICLPILSCWFSERLNNALHKSGKLYLKDLFEEDIADSIIKDWNKIKFKLEFLSRYLYSMKWVWDKNMKVLIDYFRDSILVWKSIEVAEETLESRLEDIITKTLTEREVLIFNKKSEFWNCSDNVTLDWVAAEVGVTRERVRQLLTKAEEKVKLAISLIWSESLCIKIFNNFLNEYWEIGMLDLSTRRTENISSKLIALWYKEVLSQWYDVFYLWNGLKPSDILLCIKKNLISDNLLLRWFWYIDKFVEERRYIDRHYYIEDFYNNVFGRKYQCDRADIYIKSFLYYLEKKYWIRHNDWVIWFPANRKSRTVLTAQVLFYEKDWLTYDELLTILKREYPNIEWTYSILWKCFQEFCKKEWDIYYLDEKKAKKIIKTFIEEEPFRYYKITNNNSPKTSREDKDYSNVRYYFLIEKIRTWYKSDSLRKRWMDDYLYTIYSWENRFSIKQFLKLFVSSLSEIEIDVLRYDYQYIWLYEAKTNKEMLEDKNIWLMRLIQIKNRLTEKMDEIIWWLTRIEVYDKIIETLVDKFQLSEYKVLNFTEETENVDDINWKFITFALKIILSKKFGVRYLSWNWNESEAIMVYNENKFDNVIINHMFEGADVSYELFKNRKSVSIETFIATIFNNNNSEAEKFKENLWYKYFLKEYLLHIYNIWEDNWQFIFPEIELENPNIDIDIIHKLIETLHDDVYTDKQIKTIFSRYWISNDYSDEILSVLWYKHKIWYFIKKKFNNFKDYLYHSCNKEDMIRFDKDMLDNETIFNAIIDYRQSYKIFKVNEELYVPIAKMEKLWVGAVYIEDFFKNLKNCFYDVDFFSIQNVKNKIDVKKILDLWFDDEFLENIIYYNSEISSLQIKWHKLFSYSMNDLSAIKFIEHKMEKYRVISLSNFVNEINEEYGLDLDYDMLKSYMYLLSNVFYSQTMDKLYFDKQDFYDEIY